MENTLVILPDEVKELALKVSEKKQKEIQTVLTQIFEGTSEWEKQVDAIEVKDINDIMSMEMSDTARKNVKTARLSGEKIFDTKRAEVQVEMSEFKLEDALWLKSKQIMQLKFKHIEEKAKFKSEFAKRYHAEQLELKIKERLLKVQKYNDELTDLDICNLSDDMFDVFYNGLKKEHDDKIEAEKQAELERIEAEKVEKERIEKIESENKRLEKEAKALELRNKKRNDELSGYIVFIRDYNKLLTLDEKEYQKEFIDIKKGAELQWEYDRKEAIKKQKEQDILNAKLEKERLEKEKLKADIEEREQIELEKEILRKSEEKALLLAPDKDKLSKLASDLLDYPLPTLNSIEAKTILNEVKVLINNISEHITMKSNTL